MGWNGMFKRSAKKAKVETNVVTQRGISAGGDVTGIREVAPEDVERLTKEHETLTNEVKVLRGRLGGEYDRGYEDALKKVFNVIEERDGRSGKKQILSDVQNLLAAHREEN